MSEGYRTIGIKLWKKEDGSGIDHSKPPELVRGETDCRIPRYGATVSEEYEIEEIVPYKTEDDATALKRLKKHIIGEIDDEIAELILKRGMIINTLNTLKV